MNAYRLGRSCVFFLFSSWSYILSSSCWFDGGPLFAPRRFGWERLRYKLTWAPEKEENRFRTNQHLKKKCFSASQRYTTSWYFGETGKRREKLKSTFGTFPGSTGTARWGTENAVRVGGDRRTRFLSIEEQQQPACIKTATFSEVSGGRESVIWKSALSNCWWQRRKDLVLIRTVEKCMRGPDNSATSDGN